MRHKPYPIYCFVCNCLGFEFMLNKNLLASLSNFAGLINCCILQDMTSLTSLIWINSVVQYKFAGDFTAFLGVISRCASKIAIF